MTNYFNEQYFSPQYWTPGYFDGVTSEGGDQHAYPGLFSDADSFFTPAILTSYEIAAQLFSDADAIYAPGVSALSEIRPPMHADQDAAYAPSVSSWAEIRPPLFADADVAYCPTISIPFDQELAAALFSDADVFFRPYAFGRVSMGRYTIESPAAVRRADAGDPIRLIEYPDVFSKEED